MTLDAQPSHSVGGWLGGSAAPFQLSGWWWGGDWVVLLLNS